MEAAARHGEAVRGYILRVPPVTECQAVRQDLLHGRRPRAARMIQTITPMIESAGIPERPTMPGTMPAGVRFGDTAPNATQFVR